MPGKAARQLRCVPLDRATLLVQSPVRPGRVALAKLVQVFIISSKRSFWQGLLSVIEVHTACAL